MTYLDVLILERIKVSFYDSVKSIQNSTHSLQSIADFIGNKKQTEKSELLKERTEKIRQYLAEQNVQKAKELKIKLPCVTFSACFSGARRSTCDHEETGLIFIDFDHLTDEEMKSVLEKVKQISYVVMAWKSVSGDGLHLVVLLPETGKFAQYYPLAWQCMKKDFSMAASKMDESCKDIARCSFLNYDPNVYTNWKAQPMPISLPNSCADEESEGIDANEIMNFESFFNKIGMETDNLKKYLDKVDLSCPMTKGSRHNTLISRILPFLNKAGFDKQEVIDELLTRYASPDFPRDEIVNIVEYVYKENASEYGINKKKSFEPKSQKGQKGQIEVDETEILNDFHSDMPDIKSFKSDLPGLIRPFMDEKQKEDIQWALLMSLISAYGGMAMNTVFQSDKIHHPLMSVIWTGESGAGKGQLHLIQKVVSLHEAQVQNIEKKKNQKMGPARKEWPSTRKKNPMCKTERLKVKKMEIAKNAQNIEEDEMKHLIVSSHTSESQLTFRCQQNNPYTTFYFTEEIGNMSNNREQKYGISSSCWREALEGGRLSTDYRYSEFVCVDEVRIIANIAGTKSAVQKFIDNQEDGLFARFIYVLITDDFTYKRLADTYCPDTSFWKQIEASIADYTQYCLRMHMQVMFDEECMKVLEDVLENMNKICALHNNSALRSYVHRMRNFAMSMCTTLTMLSAFENQISAEDTTREQPLEISCSLETAKLVASWLSYIFYSACQIILTLPKGRILGLEETDLTTQQIYKSLPDEFATSMMMKKAEELGMHPKTAQRRLENWVNSRAVTKLRHGVYQKNYQKDEQGSEQSSIPAEPQPDGNATSTALAPICNSTIFD